MLFVGFVARSFRLGNVMDLGSHRGCCRCNRAGGVRCCRRRRARGNSGCCLIAWGFLGVAIDSAAWGRGEETVSDISVVLKAFSIINV